MRFLDVHYSSQGQFCYNRRGSSMAESRRSLLFTYCLSVACLLLWNCVLQAQAVKNCSYPAIYNFGDSLSDVGNAIAAFPEQFAHGELSPNGIYFPMHAADRYCDGKLLCDFMAFGIRRRPNYAILRGTAPDFTYGSNFATAGASARNSSVWVKNAGFNTPFSLEVQLQWLVRYKVRLQYYYNQNPVIVVQSLPTIASLNTSLYMVYSGFQDYFFGLYDGTYTPRQALDIVGDVVDAIVTLVEGILAFGGNDIFVVNMPPLGCFPAMLTLFQSPTANYDGYGCLKDINKISASHNQLLGEKMIAMRKKHPIANLYYGDIHGVYTDILKNPAAYSVTETLKACCGTGGSYNFNKQVTCGYVGTIDNQLVNLTTSTCDNSLAYLSWDGIHHSNTVNKAAATAFLTGKHISPSGGFNCSPDFSNWDAQT